jgi:hypothetical protein
MLLTVIGMVLSGCSTIDSGKDFISKKLSSEDEMDQAVEIVDKFFGLLVEKDFKEAYKYISYKDRKERSEQDFISEFSDVTDIVKVEINWVEVKNNIALVGIDIIDKYDGGAKMYKDIEVSLVREEDGSWKIVFWD